MGMEEERFKLRDRQGDLVHKDTSSLLTLPAINRKEQVVHRDGVT